MRKRTTIVVLGLLVMAALATAAGCQRGGGGGEGGAKIGLSISTLNNPFFVSQQVDAILVNPVDPKAIVPAIQAANQANIPVLCLDRGASGGKVETLIASNNVKGGE